MSTAEETDMTAQKAELPADVLPMEDFTGDEPPIIYLLKGRADSYRLFSRLFFKPLTLQDIEEFAAADYISVAKKLEDDSLLAEGFNDMGRDLKKRHTGTRQELSTDYTMCFYGIETINGQVATPYASVFLGENELLNQEPRHKVYRIFRAESLGLKSGVDLPEDHLSFELEFLAILSERTARALEQGDNMEAIRNLELSQTFISDNIFSWYDLLAERAAKMLKTRFYRGVLKATKGYLELDLNTITGLIEAIRA